MRFNVFLNLSFLPRYWRTHTMIRNAKAIDQDMNMGAKLST